MNSSNPNHHAREILIVDDEPGIRELLSEILVEEGYRVVLAENAQDARMYRQKQEPALVLLDIWMPDTDGVTLLREWANSEQLTMPVIMMSGHATIQTAVGATKIGAFDFLEKPISLEKLLATVRRALRAAMENSTQRVSLSRLGTGTVVHNLENALARLLRARVPILILGEVGAGHEAVVNALNFSQAPWVQIKPESRLTRDRELLTILEEARDGILCCLEIGQLTRGEQKNLLFLLPRLAQHNITLLCTSSDPLGNLAAEGRFEVPLLTQLSGGIFMLPPLRDHREDIPILIERKWNEMSERHIANGSLLSALTPDTLTTLTNAYWPGNIDQLYQTLENLALVKGPINDATVRSVLGETLSQHKRGVPPEITVQFLMMSLRDAREAFERYYFERLLISEKNNMSRVAERAGLERTHLYRKLKQLNISFSRRLPRG